VTEEELAAERETLSPAECENCDEPLDHCECGSAIATALLDILWAIADEITKDGNDATVEGGEGSIPWIEVTLSDGRVATLGFTSETWSGQVYKNSDDLCEGADSLSGYDTGLSTSIGEPVQVAAAFLAHCNDKG
jgi:hypothetical protein